MINLKVVNRRLWTIEDELREHERDQKFDDRFVTLARTVYKNNDKRSPFKSADQQPARRDDGRGIILHGLLRRAIRCRRPAP